MKFWSPWSNRNQTDQGSLLYGYIVVRALTSAKGQQSLWYSQPLSKFRLTAWCSFIHSFIHSFVSDNEVRKHTENTHKEIKKIDTQEIKDTIISQINKYNMLNKYILTHDVTMIPQNCYYRKHRVNIPGDRDMTYQPSNSNPTLT